MARTNATYNIKAVSQLLGIQPGTLRAWERRYKIIRPSRNEAGHRLYTDDHIRILKGLMEKLDKGFTISQAVSLIESNEKADTRPDHFEQTTQLEKIGDDLLSGLLSFNEKEAQRHFDYAFSLFTPETVAIDVLGPILGKIGDLHEENGITSAHEHFALQFIRSRIGMMLISIPTDPLLPKALLVCGPNEHHELELLLFALFLKRKGYDVVYLRQRIDGGDMQIVIDEVKPTYMFMSCPLKKNTAEAIRVVESLQRQYTDLKIGLGGYVDDYLSELDQKKIHPFMVGNSKKDWENWLQER
ncbi:DNA-binding transcriptional regulator, MerR family [Halobacillus karajensis]|uniref:MerR family transcriptional regulator n=1 Tax=Halobacillus karajensis TaxID=195088 RepID=UPI0008A81062|nr:MerR family transcriptional regulator [Halobacillus karajensis]SEH81889.1 DNA-binding transcriptional regulator, MerR family [Halobacillus karajensis]